METSASWFVSWSVLTANFLIILSIALCAGTLSALLHMANAKWRFQVRKFAVALAVLFPIAFVLLIILLMNPESTFQWMAHAQEGGEQHLNGWHNYTFLVARQIICFLIVAGLYALFLRYQHLSEIDSSPKVQRRPKCSFTARSSIDSARPGDIFMGSLRMSVRPNYLLADM